MSPLTPTQAQAMARWAAVRRYFGAAAATIAGVVAALTPAAVLMFRFDNPDALLTLLLVGLLLTATLFLTVTLIAFDRCLKKGF